VASNVGAGERLGSRLLLVGHGDGFVRDMISIDYCPDLRGGHSLEMKESREPINQRFRSGGAMLEKTRGW